MCGNNNGLCGCFGGNNWWWIIILILLFSCCCNNNGSTWGGCGRDNDRCGSSSQGSRQQSAPSGAPAFYFMNLSMAWHRSSMASVSPAATASTMQWRI